MYLHFPKTALSILLLLAVCLFAQVAQGESELVRVTIRASHGVSEDAQPSGTVLSQQTEQPSGNKPLNETERVRTGRVLADYRADQNGFLALETDDGQIHIIKAVDLLTVEKTENKFARLNKKATIEKLKQEFGSSFDILSTDHFIFVYDTSEGYAAWCGKLFESLYSAFERFRSRKGFKLDEPEGPMIAILFGSKDEFLRYASKETPGADKIVAYYHRLTNRTVMYDLSEIESRVPRDKRRSRTYKQIDEILSRPQAAYNIATIVHEATHQITFNRKMFPRTGPFPLWFAEGLAMHFETPDENASRGWSFRGANNRANGYRLRLFRQFYRKGSVDPIKNVICEERYMENVQSSYAFSWALFYYLNEKAPKKMVKYVELMQEKIPFTVYSQENRLNDFEYIFGDDWREFYRNFDRFILSIR